MLHAKFYRYRYIILLFFRIIQKEFVSDDQIVQEHNVIIEDETSSNIEIVLNKSIEPSSNKRLKITNSNKNETINNIQNKIDVIQTNQDPLEERDDTMEKQMTITIQNENIIENEQVVQICKKSANETSVSNVINIGTSDSISSLSIMKQTDNRNDESMDTTENINPNPENSTSEVNQINSELEKGEEEILQLFQDIPKN